MWSNEHIARHFLTCLQCAGTTRCGQMSTLRDTFSPVSSAHTYLNETYHRHLLPRPHDAAGDIFKVIGSKIKVTSYIWWKFTFQAKSYQSTVRCQGPSLSVFTVYMYICYVWHLISINRLVLEFRECQNSLRIICHCWQYLQLLLTVHSFIHSFIFV